MADKKIDDLILFAYNDLVNDVKNKIPMDEQLFLALREVAIEFEYYSHLKYFDEYPRNVLQK